MNEIEALCCLTAIPLLGPIRGKQLLLRYGSALNALQANESEIAALPGFGIKLSESWKTRFNPTRWKESLRLAEAQGVTLLPWGDPNYPENLKKLEGAPLLLYIKGSLGNADKKSIAIIGTRSASRYGLDMAYRLAGELSQMGWTIVSGLARGIDTAAHRGALTSGRTLAVIGSGLANIYPPENSQLAHAITSKGCLISEFAMQQPPDRGQFPQRNRIVSGLSTAVLLIEAPIKSGAMLTMEKARQHERPCFAIPGRIDTDTFRGNHLLIKEGKAKLVEGSADILHSLGSQVSVTAKPEQLILPLLSEEERLLLKVFPDSEITIDELIESTQLPVQKIQVLVMKLTLKKIIQEYPGKVYKRRHSPSQPPVNAPSIARQAGIAHE